jgi:predicted aconitase with swiveling domain
VPGDAVGETLVSHEPLSFWGGYDADDGSIIDQRHPLYGVSAKGRVLVLPGSRGSSTTSAVLLESVRNGTAPTAIITCELDGFIALSAIVAGELYDRILPVVAVTPDTFAAIPDRTHVSIVRDGAITLHAK